MENGHVTTPFGRRGMTLGMLASQVSARNIDADKAIDKWKLFRALCAAKPLLGITDRALAVMNALLSFYPKPELSEKNGLIVFPSNAQLCLRAHGMGDKTLRRHVAVLVNAGLLVRKDSPNGKRYARKDGAGNVDEAFGFSLAPLLARAEEIDVLAQQVLADREHLLRLREQLTLCRRDISKLVEMALDERVPGDWQAISIRVAGLTMALPRAPDADQLPPVLEEMRSLRQEVLNQLESQIKVQNTTGNDGQTDRHIQNSKPDSTFDSEPRFERKQGAASADYDQDRDGPIDLQTVVRPANDGLPAGRPRLNHDGAPVGPPQKFPLGLVLQACPEIALYGPGGTIGQWRDLMAAAVVVRSMLGVSASAYEEACAVLGPENAATVIACILERAGHITSAGGYLRDLTRRASQGAFSIGPMLMSLARSGGVRQENQAG